MKHPKVEIYKHFQSANDPSEDEWGWRLKAANGEIVAQGEGHGSPRDAERAFRTVVSTVIEVLQVFFDEPGGWRDIVIVVEDD